MTRVIPGSLPQRRRASSADPLKKVTLRLHTRVAEAVRTMVDAGEAPSADVFVEQAVIAALRERRRERLYQAYAEAAHDEAFAGDMAEVSNAFEPTLNDGITSAE
jgi:Arc/MetJ-type ribon-helix-helix transcriptional regulator